MTSGTRARPGLGLGLLEGGLLVSGTVKRIDSAAPGSNGIQRKDDQPDTENSISCSRIELLGEEAPHCSADDAGRLNEAEARSHYTSAIAWIGRLHQSCLICDRVYRVAKGSNQQGEPNDPQGMTKCDNQGEHSSQH